MEKQLVSLIKTATLERAVARQKLSNGMLMFAYPMDGGGFIVGVGYDREKAHQVTAEDVLRKRSAQMEKYGKWLPSLFTDGSFYVVRRVTKMPPNPDHSPLASDDLLAAQELLS